jgi:hypothetical protein
MFAGIPAENWISFIGLIAVTSYGWVQARKDWKDEVEYNKRRDEEYHALVIKSIETHTAQAHMNEKTQDLLKELHSRIPVQNIKVAS